MKLLPIIKLVFQPIPWLFQKLINILINFLNFARGLSPKYLMVAIIILYVVIRTAIAYFSGHLIHENFFDFSAVIWIEAGILGVAIYCAIIMKLGFEGKHDNICKTQINAFTNSMWIYSFGLVVVIISWFFPPAWTFYILSIFTIIFSYLIYIIDKQLQLEDNIIKIDCLITITLAITFVGGLIYIPLFVDGIYFSKAWHAGAAAFQAIFANLLVEIEAYKLAFDNKRPSHKILN